MAPSLTAPESPALHRGLRPRPRASCHMHPCGSLPPGAARAAVPQRGRRGRGSACLQHAQDRDTWDKAGVGPWPRGAILAQCFFTFVCCCVHHTVPFTSEEKATRPTNATHLKVENEGSDSDVSDSCVSVLSRIRSNQ